MKRELDLPKEKAQFNLIKGAEGCWRWEQRAKTGGHVILIRSDLHFPWRQKKPSADLNEVDFSDFVSLDASFDSVSPTLVTFAASFFFFNHHSERPTASWVITADVSKPVLLLVIDLSGRVS